MFVKGVNIMTATKKFSNPVEETAALLALLRGKTHEEKIEVLRVTEGAKIAAKHYSKASSR